MHIEEHLVSGSVAMMQIRGMHTFVSREESPQAPIWAELLNRPGVQSVLALRKAGDQPLIQATLATLARDNVTNLLAFFIIFDQAD